ncbi:hypothetical protein K525DRAFT_252028 [Schizophyllum commune Loenen D]|nr:hypothetical protein K525DRAFT_252028 [Schizophyllum commune Loenen D]
MYDVRYQKAPQIVTTQFNKDPALAPLMNNYPSPGSSSTSTDDCCVPSKRKWTSKIMKTWVASDPSTTAPVVEHGDPKAAVRNAKKKKQRLERKAAAKAPPEQRYRVIRRGASPSRNNDVMQDGPVLPSGLLPIRQREGLTEEDSTAFSAAIDHFVPSLQTSPRVVPNHHGDVDMGTATHEGDIEHLPQGHATLQPAQVEDTNMDVAPPLPATMADTTMSTDDNEAIHPDTSVEALQCAVSPEDTGTRKIAGGMSDGDSVSQPSTTIDLHACRNTGDGMRASAAHSVPSADRPANIGAGGDSEDECSAPSPRSPEVGREVDFNVGWRRFGPRGQDITGYVPRFPDAPTVNWPGDLVTGAPYLPDERRGKAAKNKLEWDFKFVKTAARTLKSSRDRPDLCVHATFTNERDAVELIKKCTATGMPLVFDEFPDSLKWAHGSETFEDDPFMDPIRWSADPVDGVVGANLKTPRDFQDAAIRELKPLHPYVTANLLEFRTWLKMPGKASGPLSIFCTLTDVLRSRIADNVVESCSQSYGNKYEGHFAVVADMLRTHDWFLLHTAGFLTFGHIDASGMATSAQIRGGGMKEWIVFRSSRMPKPKPGDSREQRRLIQSQLVRRVGDLITAASTDSLEAPVRQDEDDWFVDGCIIELRPGMKYYQPAGTVHAAYTPVPTAAAGMHYFTYDDLHRMEVSRRVQRTKVGITNHNHNCGVQLMLITMAAALPMRAASGQTFRRKPMIALALMLTRPQDYIPPPDPLHPVNAVRGHRKKRKGRTSTPTAEEREKLKAKLKEMRAENAERRDEFNLTQKLRSERWAEDGTAFDRLAYTVAMRILIACKTKYPGDARAEIPGPEYILEGEHWEDPGPKLDIESITDDLAATHVDDIVQEESDEGSDSDLTDLD